MIRGDTAGYGAQARYDGSGIEVCRGVKMRGFDWRESISEVWTVYFLGVGICALGLKLWLLLAALRWSSSS